jgi:beta-lactamase regulating signal transducer with metallopeptidase domain
MAGAVLLALGPKAAAILVLAECAARTFGRRAGLRAAIRSAGLCALLLVPAFSILLPHSRLHLPMPAEAGEWLPQAAADSAAAVRPAAVAVTRAVPPRVERVPQPPSGHALPTWTAGAGLLVWLAGALLLGGRVAIDVWRVRRLERRASVLHVPGLDRLCAGAGVSVEIRTLETDAVVAPLLCGVRRPTILMPVQARGWRREEVEMALVHELAHVRRRDYAVHLLSEIVRAAYWPNPLVWYVAGSAAADREQACDDAVLAAGAVPSAYAEQLLGLARRLAPPPGALALVRISSLKRRIRALLRTDLDRRPLGRPARRLVELTAMAGAVAVACLDVAASAPPAVMAPCQPPSAIETTPAPRQPDPRVRALLAAGEARVREAAAWAIENPADRGTEAALESQMLHGDDVHGRLMAATILRELREPRSVPALVAALDDPAFCVRWTATRSIRDLHDPRALARVSEIYRTDPNADVRVMAARAIGAIGAPASVAVLVEGLADCHADVREKTIQSLSRLGRPEALPALAARLSDPNPVVRCAAARAIDRINARRTSNP